MKKYIYFVRGNLHRDMAIVSAQSVLRVDDEAELSICTDDKTDLTPCKPHFHKLAHATFGAPLRLMTANVSVIADYVLASEVDDEMWFIDPDTLLQKPLEMPPEAEAAFTWRIATSDIDAAAIGDMPYNFGVVGFTGTAAARDASIWLRERVAHFAVGYQDWYGNQLAAVELAGPIPKDGEHPVVERGIPWRPFEPPASTIQIARLPCADWNYTPSSFDEYPSTARLLHFKGLRRHLMPQWARALGYAMEDFPSE